MAFRLFAKVRQLERYGFRITMYGTFPSLLAEEDNKANLQMSSYHLGIQSWLLYELYLSFLSATSSAESEERYSRTQV